MGLMLTGEDPKNAGRIGDSSASLGDLPGFAVLMPPRHMATPDVSPENDRKNDKPTRTEGSSQREALPRPKAKLRKPEPTPVIAGRLLIAGAMLFLLWVVPSFPPFGNALEPKGPPPTDTSNWKTGETANVIITLITADYNLLFCASPTSFEGRHCAYKSANEPWPREPGAPLDDNKANIIQPYRTWYDNKLVLVAGLWSHPDLAMRLHNEPTFGVQNDKLARFVTECRVRFVSTLEKPLLRWQPGAAWNPDNSTPIVPVGIAESCKIIEEPSRDCPGGPVCAFMETFG